jgi:NAD+ kinase
VRLARLTRSSFTDRLVAKFDLSVVGWRGNGHPASAPEQPAELHTGGAGDDASRAAGGRP